MTGRPRLTALAALLFLLAAGLGFWLSREKAPPATSAAAVRPAQERAAGPGPAPSGTAGPGASWQAAAARPSSSPGAAAASPARIVAAPWGNGPGQLGHELGEERNAEGPPAVTPLPDGGFAVLDAVNGRLQRYDRDGAPGGSLPLSQRLPQDVVALPDGSTLVLDRLADRSVAILGPDGEPRGELPLLGPGVAEGGGVTGLFVEGDRVLVEYEHGNVVELGDVNGAPAAERPVLEGRPSRDGRSLLNAGLVDGPTGRLWVSASDRVTQEARFTRELRTGEPIWALLSLDSDAAGGIYVGLAAGEEGNERTRVLCLGPDGSLAGGVEVPASTGPEDLFRPVSVSADGEILVLRVGAEGAEIHRLRCRPLR